MVIVLLFAGRHLLETAIEEILPDAGRLSAADTAFLLALQAFPSSSQTALASILGRDKTTLSRTVSRLESMGLVTDRLDPVDGRRRILELSDEATSLAVPALQSVRDRLASVLSSLTAEEEKGCLRLMDMLMKELLVA